MKYKTLQFFVLYVAILVSCDPFQEDSISKETQVTVNKSATEYYILPNSSTVIDLKAIVNSSFTNATLKVSENPRRGVLKSLGDFLLMYEPGVPFTSGMDQFKVSISNDGKVLATETLTVHMTNDTTEFPCSLYAVEDFVIAKRDSSVTIKFLSNDRICGVIKSEIQASIFSQPKNGQAVMAGDSIVFTPKQGFVGRDSIIYKIEVVSNIITDDTNSLVSYGIVSMTVIKDSVEHSTKECFSLVDDFATFYVDPNRPLMSYSFLLTLNDSLCSIDINYFSDLTLIKAPVYGNAISSFDGSNTIRFGLVHYIPNSVFTQNVLDSLVYQLCYSGTCKTAKLTFNFKTVNVPCEFELNNDIYTTLRHTVSENLADEYSSDAFFGNDVLCSTDYKEYDFSIVANPKYGQLTNRGPYGGIGYTKDSPFTETYTDSFVYQLCLGGRCKTATVRLYFILDNICAVVANDDYLDLTDPSSKPIQDGEYPGGYEINWFSNDVTCGGFGFHLVSSPSHGNVGLELGGRMLYLPDSMDVQDDSFQYEICLTGGDIHQCSIGTVYIKRQ